MKRFGLFSPVILLTFVPCVLLALSFASTPTPAPTESKGAEAIRLNTISSAGFAEALEAEEPGWDFIPGVCTCPPTYGGQKAQGVVGGWRREPDGMRREVVSIDVYEIVSTEEAAEGMKGYGRGGPGSACRVEECAFGDEAYLSDCWVNPKDTVRENITVVFRRGRYVVSVRGGARETVERFAGHVLRRLPAS
jgi:hypothetical protein